MEHAIRLETRRGTKDRLMHLLDAYHAMGPDAFFDGYDAEDEETGEKGFALKVHGLMHVFTFTEGVMIADLLSEIARDRPDIARTEGLKTLTDAVRAMMARNAPTRN